MSRSWRRITPQLAATTTPASHVADLRSGYRYDVVVRSGHLWQIETRPDDPRHRIERRAEYQVGSGHHAVAWLAAENGFLIELPVGWFGQTALWRMNPGYELKNHRFSRPIPAGCVGCHATQATHEAPTANRFALPVADGIGCSRCHGDANEHVAFWKSGNNERKDVPSSVRRARPGRLTSERVNDVCLQCHLQGDVIVQRGQSSPFDFQPGQRLIEQRHDFLIAGQPDTLGVASHGARLLQSRCYSASGERLTCIHCHDPHRPAADFNAAYYDAKCLACHQPQACSRPLTDAREPASSGCVACHLPQRSTREGIHLVFTDHAIRRRPVALPTAPPAILAPDIGVELASAWPNVKPDAGTLGAAYVVLHETMGPQQPSLARARQLLAEAVAQNPKDLASRYWLGSALLALGRPIEARAELLQVLSQQPTHHEARFRLALSEEGLGNLRGAIDAYTRLVAESPNWPEPYSRLARLYLSQQRAAEAADILRKLVALRPEATAYAYLALAERLGGASQEQALATVAKAILLDSREPTAYVSRGTLWLLSRRTKEARADFDRALTLDPTNTAARQALSALPSN